MGLSTVASNSNSASLLKGWLKVMTAFFSRLTSFFHSHTQRTVYMLHIHSPPSSALKSFLRNGMKTWYFPRCLRNPNIFPANSDLVYEEDNLTLPWPTCREANNPFTFWASVTNSFLGGRNIIELIDGVVFFNLAPKTQRHKYIQMSSLNSANVDSICCVFQTLGVNKLLTWDSSACVIWLAWWDQFNTEFAS